MSATSSAYRKAARKLAQSASSQAAARSKSMELSPVGSFRLPECLEALATGTMVAPPLFRSIRQNPIEGVKLQLERVQVKFLDAFRLAAAYIASKPSILSSARLQLNRSSIVPTAKELHRSLSEAFAAGDLATLRRVCLPTLYNALSAQVSRRPMGIRRQWELVSYTSTLLYPRIADHKMMAIPRPEGGIRSSAHQAIVTISSRQRLTQFDDNKGGVSIGQPKELNVVEHLILVRELDSKTFTPGDWRVFGYADETTYQAWQEEKRGLALMSRSTS